MAATDSVGQASVIAVYPDHASAEEAVRRLQETLEGRIKAAKTHLESMSGQADKVVREKLEKAHQKLQAQKESVEQTRAKLKTRAKEKLSETKEAINEWMAKREAHKLNARADRAEAHAADALDYAMNMIDADEEAVLEAVVGRIDADDAQTPVRPVAEQMPPGLPRRHDLPHPSSGDQP